MEVKVNIGEIKRIGEDTEKEGEIVLIKLRNEEQKREVMGRKNLKERKNYGGLGKKGK